MANRKQKARRAERREARKAPAPSPSPRPSPRPAAKARVQARKQNGPAEGAEGTRMPVPANSGGRVSRRDVNNAGSNVRTNNVRARDRTPEQKLERRQERQTAYQAQNTTEAADFNFADRTKNKVGAGEVRHLRKQGYDRESIQAAAAESGLRVGGKAQKRFDNWDARRAAKERVNATPVEPTPQEPVQEVDNTPTAPPTQTINRTPSTEVTPVPEPYKVVQPQPPTYDPNPSPSPGPRPSPYSSNENEQNTDYTQELNINQDNDINTNINGDGNYVHNTQDNSIRNYGGDVRTFNYQGSGGGTDSPVSAATMAGYYAPSDGHAANAARLDRQITQAGDYAKDNMNTDWIAQGAIHKAGMNTFIDPKVLDDRVTERSEASKAKAHMMGEGIYGDIFGKMPQWGNLNS